jgi:8-oxo-dGTP diphosphatase/2-hydroxy-dATP diphosphatase
MPKILTLCVVHEPGRILLGMKKRGFGAGKWNGFGGKVGAHETIEAAAKREVLEECGLTVEEMQGIGKLNFTFEGGTDVLEVNIFDVTKWSGEIIESEEMKPEWFALGAIPYDQMWADDEFWLPALLEGKSISGAFHFAADGSVARNELVIG